jgi:hypothetical protein
MHDRDRALLWRQAPEGPLELVAIGQARFRIWRRRLRRQDADVQLPDAPTAGFLVRGADGEPVAPTVEPGGIAEAGQLPPGIEQCLLDRVGGTFGIAEDPEGHGIQGVDFRRSQGSEGVAIALLRQCDEVLHSAAPVLGTARMAALNTMPLPVGRTFNLHAAEVPVAALAGMPSFGALRTSFRRTPPMPGRASTDWELGRWSRIHSADQMIDEALTRLGMPVPDSALARQARELIADVASPSLVNHSVRSYAWAVDLAGHDRLEFDPEILYVAAMLHDVGLVPGYDIGGGYEVDGAIAAERFAREAGEPEARARAIYDVIALHNNDELPPNPAPEVVLLWDSTGVDVTGERFTDVRSEIVPALLAAYPRVDFKREFSALFADQASRKPTSKAAAMAAAGMLEAIAQAPFDS